MNQVLETRSPRVDGNQARAGREDRQRVYSNNTDPVRTVQARHPQASIRCTENVALELAHLIYGEGRL